MTLALPQAIGFSLALLGGSTAFDGHLADYQWNVNPRASWGVRAEAESGRFGLGARLTGARTSQTLGVPDPSSSAAVAVTTLEGIGSCRIATLAGFDLRADITSGWLRLGYQPDRVEIPAGGGLPAMTVSLDPVNAWIGGAGLGIRHGIAGPWSAGGSIERRVFSLETAHRNGASIETGRESFGDWSARFELAWRPGRS